jgi:prolyl-tRNA synthetase
VAASTRQRVVGASATRTARASVGVLHGHRHAAALVVSVCAFCYHASAMRYSKAFIPTQKEAPKDAVTPSHILMLRAGYARLVGAGLYELLPLGLRVLHKIANIVREEMDRAGAQELLMPAVLPAEYFRESGRWDSFGDTLIRFTDRKGGDYHLGPTHEEIITDLVRREVKSYRQLPLNLYQIQMKYRDEPRPRAGLLRCREFLMKDAYSFDVSEEKALDSYATMRDAYQRIFRRLGLDYRIVAADSGAMGGSTSAEFQVLAQNGEDAIVACTSCDYAANIEVAEAHYVESSATASEMLPREKIHTPNVHTIDEVVGYLRDGTRPETMLKALLYVANGTTVMVLVRGDHDVNEIRLARVLGVAEVRLASESEVERATKAKIGFAGPVGFDGKLYIDRAATHTLNAVTGANETDYHLRNVNLGRDFDADVVDVRAVAAGDACPTCGEPLQLYRGIEGGHIFVLGTHYSDKMRAMFLDETGEQKPVVMGCYGIGVSRLVAAAIEQYNDDNGIAWPMPIAPYHVIITPLGKNDDQVDGEAKRIYDELRTLGVEVLLDDREERPGVKFKDADLLGIPLRLTIGARGLKENQVELKGRTDSDATMVPLAEITETIRALVIERGGLIGRS